MVVIPEHLICLDPGKRTGFAEFWNAKLMRFGTVKDTEIWDWLRGQRPDIFLYENFRVRPQAAGMRANKNWSSPFALQVIGGLKSHCAALDIKLIKQEPSILPIGCGFLEIPYKKGVKLKDHLSAMAHGAYFFVRDCGMNPQELRDIQKNDGLQIP